VPPKVIQTPAAAAAEESLPELQRKPVEQETKDGASFSRESTVCLPNWRQITQGPWILEVVKGYQLELVQTPSQTIGVISVARSPTEC